MFGFIKDIMLRLTGVRAVLVKIIDSVQSAIRVLELVQKELAGLGLPESSANGIALLKDWLTVIASVLNKVLSIKIDDALVFTLNEVDPIEELKKKLEELKSI